MNTYLLYSTLGCHLCEEAERVIGSAMDASKHTVTVQDIAESDQLVERYGIRIPVLRCTRSGKELNWPFSQSQVAQLFAQG